MEIEWIDHLMSEEDGVSCEVAFFHLFFLKVEQRVSRSSVVLSKHNNYIMKRILCRCITGLLDIYDNQMLFRVDVYGNWPLLQIYSVCEWFLRLPDIKTREKLTFWSLQPPATDTRIYTCTDTYTYINDGIKHAKTIVNLSVGKIGMNEVIYAFGEEKYCLHLIWWG